MSNDKVFLTEEVKERWAPVIKGESFEPIHEAATERMVNIVLENMLQEAPNGGTGDVITNPTGAGGTGALDNYDTNGRLDPVLIKLVRRAMPALVANDLVGVQPMTGPTGLIFALRSWYGGDAATRTVEAFSPPTTEGDPTTVSPADQYYSGNKDMGAGTNDGILTTPEGEALGTGYSGLGDGTTDGTTARTAFTDDTNVAVTQTTPWNEMSFSIEKSMVSAETRALKARYTTELAQDLRVTHGLDAATELSNILSTEIVTEQNREIINLISASATVGAQDTTVNGVDVAGTFLLSSADLKTRWEVESYKMMLMMIVREANLVAKLTGRGSANRLIVSPEVANALDMVTALSNESPTNVTNISNSSGVGVTYAGTILAGRFKVYVDQYASAGSIVMGYKGSNVYDAGMYYCPYVPLQMMRAIGEEDFQPRIGFKTRYGIAYNPFGAGNYYRKFTVSGI